MMGRPMHSPLRLILGCWFLVSAWAGIDQDVCLPVERSCGPVPPPLPINFEIKGQFIDKQEMALAYEEVYYDFDNLRGKYMLLSKAIEVHLIFDYNASQIIEYFILHPGSTVKEDPLSFGCSAEEMEYSDRKKIFGYRYGVNGLTNTPMYDSSHVLRFGGPYLYAYNGSNYGSGASDDSSDDNSDYGRGLLWDAFIGCVYERESEMTALMRYKFSGPTMLASGGSIKGDVDGSGHNDSLSVPLGVDYRGTAIKTDPVSGNRSYVTFDISQQFSRFKANPVFDNKDFQIPPWMHCSYYRGWKEMPKFPTAFSVRVETTAVSQDKLGKRITGSLVSVDQLYYYKEKGLARRDYTPHIEKDKDILAKFGNLGPVKTVYDYKTFQIYVINKATGRCYTTLLERTAYFSTPRDTVFTEMATPEELFLMQQDEMEYKGQYFTRDIECDVWSGKLLDKITDMTLFKETYFSTNGWHFDADEKVEYGVPVKHTIIVNTAEKTFVRTVSETNFFKFKSYAPVLATFDVSECVETLPHKYYAIKLFIPEEGLKTLLQTYRFLFLEAAQYYVANISDLASPLRIQRIALSILKDDVLLTFAMVEKPNAGDILNPTAGLSVEYATEKLKMAIDKGEFEITFIHPETKERLPVTAEPGNLFDWYPGAKEINVTKEWKRPGVFENNPQIIDRRLREEHEHAFYVDTATQSPPKPKNGMSPGALGGLAIAMLIIGIAVGVAVMYLYIRKHSDLHGNEYVMHTTG